MSGLDQIEAEGNAYLKGIDAAVTAGNFDAAHELTNAFKQWRLRKEPPPEPMKLGQEGMPDAIRAIVKGEDKSDQLLAGAGSAPVLAAQGIAQLAGAQIDPAVQNQQALRGATPYTQGGNMGGNAAMFGVAPTQMIGRGAMAMGAKAFPRIGQVADMAATQGATAAATTPGEASDRLISGVMGVGGSAVPAAVGMGQGVRRTGPLSTQAGRQMDLAEALRRELGPEADALESSLRGRYPGSSYGVNPTAAMLTRNPTLEVMETGSRVRSGDQWTNLDRMNASARWKALEDSAGTPQELERLRAARNAITGPMRETALSDANKTGVEIPALKRKLSSQTEARLNSEREAMVSALQDKGRFESRAAQMDERGSNFTPVPGMPRVSSRISDFPERVAEAESAAADARKIYEARRGQVSATQAELDRIHSQKTTSLEDSLGPLRAKLSELSSPSGALRPNRDVQTLVNYVGDELEKGVSPEQLYTIRKSLTDGIKAAPTSELSQAARAARPQRMELIGLIDKTLDDMSGGGWQKYLETYKISSPLINSRESMQKMRDALSAGRPMGEVPASMGERPAPLAFGRALENFGTKQFGSKEFDQLIPQHRALAETLLSDLNAQAGVMQPSRVLGSPTASFGANAGRVNQVTNSMIDAAGNMVPVAGHQLAASVKGSMQRQSEETLARLLQNPEALADELKRAALAAELLKNSGRVGAGASAAARSAKD